MQTSKITSNDELLPRISLLNTTCILLFWMIVPKLIIFSAPKIIYLPQSHSALTKRKNSKFFEKKAKNGPQMLFNKLKTMGENFLGKFPNKKILPILKRNKNRNFMWIIFFVMKFTKILRERTFFAKYKKLTPHHFKLLNDNSEFHQKIGLKTKTDDFLLQKV